MASIASRLESILFISARPLTVKKLAELTGHTAAETQDALNEMVERYRGEERGIQINHLGQSYQMATTPESSSIVKRFLDEEEKKELTKPSLETLTIIAYRGPITKEELELIRGVNCSLILRNLLIRGLIDTEEDQETKLVRYRVSFDFLHYLGIREPRELPDFEKLNSDENLQKLFNDVQRGEIASEDQQPARELEMEADDGKVESETSDDKGGDREDEGNHDDDDDEEEEES